MGFEQNPAGLAPDVLHETGHTASLAAWGYKESESTWDSGAQRCKLTGW